MNHIRLVAEFDVNEQPTYDQWQRVLEPLREALRALPFLREPIVTLQVPPDSLTPLVVLRGEGSHDPAR